jgi:ABC-type dipeptide/oligopeptide/nickel transport system ATPase subunit
MSAAIQFNNVSLNYGSKNDVVEVLKSINFSVNSEETKKLLGSKKTNYQRLEEKILGLFFNPST